MTSTVSLFWYLFCKPVFLNNPQRLLRRHVADTCLLQDLLQEFATRRLRLTKAQIRVIARKKCNDEAKMLQRRNARLEPQSPANA